MKTLHPDWIVALSGGSKQPISRFDRNQRPWRYLTMNISLDIIIPTLNAGAWLGATLQEITRDLTTGDQIRIVDGGSDDDTILIATNFREAGVPLDIMTCGKGRGRQLAAGAEQSTADWLLFWHADTLPGDNWRSAITRFQTETSAGTAGYFRFRLDDNSHPGARRIEHMVDRRCRWLGLPYGDQGLLIRRGDYQQAGGFRFIALMEDVDLVRRLGRRNLRPVNADAVTSAIRYQRDGYWLRPLRNLGCLTMYYCGVSPDRIARFYR